MNNWKVVVGQSSTAALLYRQSFSRLSPTAPLAQRSLYPYSPELSTFLASALNRLLYNYYPRVERLNLLSNPNATLLNIYNQIRIASDKLKPKATKRLVATSMDTYNALILKKRLSSAFCLLPSAFCLPSSQNDLHLELVAVRSADQIINVVAKSVFLEAASCRTRQLFKVGFARHKFVFSARKRR